MPSFLPPLTIAKPEGTDLIKFLRDKGLREGPREP